jgi:glucose-6-phosphate dehydrogenase assembly protein OpcA
MSNGRDVVHPEALLKQLDALWTEFGKGESDAANGVVRACSLTWITVIEGDNAALAEVDAMLADVMRVHPSRAIVINLRDGEERGLKGSVSAQCWRPFGSKQQVCIERVLLETTRAGACDLPAVIRALIVADLPVVVFCRNAHLLSVPGVAETSSLADRVVVDMAWRETECHDVWPRMPALGKYVSDLAWDRIRGFRRAIAEYFSTTSARRILAGLTSVRVETRAGHPTPEAAYLLTWVLGCMGYRRVAGGPKSARSWQKDGLALEAGFVAAPEPRSSAEAAAGAEAAVIQAIEFRGGSSAVRFALHPEASASSGQAAMDTETILVPCLESDTALLSDEMVVEHRRRTFEHHLEETIQLFEEPAYFADK